MASKKVVENPVVIAIKVDRKSGTDDKNRVVTTYEPYAVAAAAVAAKVASDMNARISQRDGSKTTRTYVVMPTEGKNSVPVIENAEDYAVQMGRENKRKALNAIPAETRAILGLAAPDASDEILDAWTPNATAKVTTKTAKA